MSDKIDIQVTGFDELKSKIILLSNDKDKKREVITILKQVARPTLQAAIANASKSKKGHWVSGKREKKKITPGNLKKSITFINSKSENPTVLIGASTKNGKDGWYAHFVHEGHNLYEKGFKRKHKAGANEGMAKSRTKANPFFRIAENQTKGLVTLESEQKIAKFIQKRIDKLSTNV